MSVPEAIVALQFCATSLLLWLVWHYGWKRWALARLRQRLFAVRDQLFDIAADPKSGLAFNSLAYTQLRNTLNNAIRFSHAVGATRIFTCLALSKLRLFDDGLDFNSYESPADEAIKQITDADLKRKLLALRVRSVSHLFGYLSVTSPTFVLLIVASLARAIVKTVFRVERTPMCQEAPPRKPAKSVVHFKVAFRTVAKENLHSAPVRSIEFQANDYAETRSGSLVTA